MLTAPLADLQQAGIVRKRIPQEILSILPKSPWLAIYESASQLLTKEGLSVSVDCLTFLEQIARVEKMNLKRVANRKPAEHDATERQLNFLRDLGVSDETFLSGLGIEQASKVIEYVLANR